MRLRHCVIVISFSPSFVMSCRGRASSLKSQVVQASISFISREVSRLSFSALPILNRTPGLSVAAWVKATRVTNVPAPIDLDASHSVWPIASADGIICINMVHISPWEATLGLIKGAAAILPPTSPLYLYGPYIREGFAIAPSNQAFDRSLRDRNPNWGLRDVEAVAAIAQSVGFSAPVITEMPANNLSVVFRRM
jgi:Protein of unknown function (DUF938)